MEATKATQGKVTGVIIPPPEIRAVVDKTASFVAKIGKSFEQRVLNSAEGQTPKFNFMKPFDPYHAYYEMKIREGEQLLAGGPVAAPAEESKAPAGVEETKNSSDSNTNADTKAASKASVATAAKATILNPIAQLAQTKPTEAPPELEFIVAQSRPAGLTALDLDIIKLAAQYTAVNGREFLATLALREQRNPQYDFLKPTHMLFSYFTYLVDCYAKIVNPSAQLIEQIEAKCDWKTAMEVSVRRWQWVHELEERKRRENSEQDEDRVAFQAIDWFDFTVVETIDFPEDELLEMPGLSAMDIGGAADAPSGGQAAVPPPPPPARANTATSNSSINSSSSYYAPLPSAVLSSAEGEAEGMQETEMEQEEDLSDLRVVTDYQHSFPGSSSSSATGPSSNTAVMVDPISGKVVPVDQMSEHMRVQLLDPRWRQQQQRFVDKQKETGFAEGGSIADSLKNFARKRGDIFGQAATGTGANSAQAIAEQEALERRKAEVNTHVYHTARCILYLIFSLWCVLPADPGPGAVGRPLRQHRQRAAAEARRRQQGPSRLPAARQRSEAGLQHRPSNAERSCGCALRAASDDGSSCSSHVYGATSTTHDGPVDAAPQWRRSPSTAHVPHTTDAAVPSFHAPTPACSVLC